jgi:hypothetical protein
MVEVAMLQAMYFITLAAFIVTVALFSWALVFRSDFRKDVFGGKQGEAKIFGLITVKGAAILVLFGIFVGAIGFVFNLLDKADQRQNSDELSRLKSQVSSQATQLTEFQTSAKKLVFRPIDETDIPYCNRDSEPAGAPPPRAVRLHDAAGRPNLALLAEARATGSSLIPLMPPGENQPVSSRHRYSYINDGWYNNCRSWVAASMPASIEVNFGGVYQVSGVAFGSEHDAFYKDRAAIEFKIETSLDNANWTLVLEHARGEPIANTTTFNFVAPVSARVVKLIIESSTPANYPTSPGAVRVDELEIFGVAERK